MRLIFLEQFLNTYQIADCLRVDCIVLKRFLGGIKKAKDTPYTACDSLLVRRSKTRLIKYRVHLHQGLYDLIASSADARGVDNFWAMEAQFYFAGAGLSCGAMKIRR